MRAENLLKPGGAEVSKYLRETCYNDNELFSVYVETEWKNELEALRKKKALEKGQGKSFEGYPYFGELLDGTPHGYGEYTDVQGTVFKGTFKNGIEHGIVIEINNYGDRTESLYKMENY